jgi:hypothetical protein
MFYGESATRFDQTYETLADWCFQCDRASSTSTAEDQTFQCTSKAMEGLGYNLWALWHATSRTAGLRPTSSRQTVVALNCLDSLTVRNAGQVCDINHLRCALVSEVAVLLSWVRDAGVNNALRVISYRCGAPQRMP